MSRNIFEKESVKEAVTLQIPEGGGELPYIALLVRILEKVSPMKSNGGDKSPALRCILNSLGLICSKDAEEFARLAGFIGMNAAAHVPDGEMDFSEAPEGFAEMRDSIKEALLERAKAEAEGNRS